MTRLEAAEMRFLRSVKGYTRLDKIRREVVVVNNNNNNNNNNKAKSAISAQVSFLFGTTAPSGPWPPYSRGF
jgi:hypothetical protein